LGGIEKKKKAKSGKYPMKLVGEAPIVRRFLPPTIKQRHAEQREADAASAAAWNGSIKEVFADFWR
jgi:hypothetical protein